MIVFNKDEQTFHLYNDNISYYIYLNNHGYLETIYLGKRLDSINIKSSRTLPNLIWYHRYYDNELKEEHSYDENFTPKTAPLEVSSHGLDDNRFSPIVVKKSNGETATNFTYLSHIIYEWLPT